MNKNNSVTDCLMCGACPYGINTITTSLGSRQRDIDISKLPTPKIYVGPWGLKH